jgi:hypothetical protein
MTRGYSCGDLTVMPVRPPGRIVRLRTVGDSSRDGGPLTERSGTGRSTNTQDRDHRDGGPGLSGRGYRSTALGVFLAVTFMVIMTAAGPAAVFFRVVVVPIARGMKWIISDAEPAASAPESATGSPQPGEETETGKTDPA